MLAVSSFLLFSVLHLNSLEASLTRLDLILAFLAFQFRFHQDKLDISLTSQ